MKIRQALLAATFLISCWLATAQSTENPPRILVRAARALDIKAGTYINDAAILVEGERIKEVGRASDLLPRAPKDAQVIDLGSQTVLPGLIDCHTHLMLRLSNEPNAYAVNLLTKSQAYRALEGAADARATLEAGFTSVRDAENEGSGYADVALRDAINRGLVEGPRMQVATRAIAAVGQYNPFGISPDLINFPTGAQMISGTEEARRAVREQIGQGADLIKVYADWEHPTLTVEEMRVIVEEAHKLGRKVAAHATTPEGIRNAVTAGVDSIEHGHGADRQDLEMMKAKGTYLVPTLSPIDARVARTPPENISPGLRHLLADIDQAVRGAKELGVIIADGSDAGSPSSHGRNAEELVSMTKRGLTPLESIRAATLNASALMGWQDQIGTIEPGKYADIISVTGDPLSDVAVLRNVRFVMKAGKVVKSSISTLQH